MSTLHHIVAGTKRPPLALCGVRPTDWFVVRDGKLRAPESADICKDCYERFQAGDNPVTEAVAETTPDTAQEGDEPAKQLWDLDRAGLEAGGESSETDQSGSEDSAALRETEKAPRVFGELRNHDVPAPRVTQPSTEAVRIARAAPTRAAPPPAGEPKLTPAQRIRSLSAKRPAKRG